MLTRVMREEVKRAAEAADSRIAAKQAEIAEHNAAIDALKAEIADIKDRQKLYTQELKAAVDEYERVNNR